MVVGSAGTGAATRLAAGVLWTYGGQLATVMVQLLYAAVTSRILSGPDFGAYGIALAAAAMVTLLSAGGLGQAVGRMQVVEPARIRALGIFGLGLGTCGALVLLISAPAWATLWGVATAEEPIRWAALTALVAPWLGLAGGLLRRQGRFRAFSLSALASNIVGMAMGVVAAIIWPTPSALLVSPIVGQAGTAFACLALNANILVGRPSWKDTRQDLGFSWRLTVASLMSYVNVNTGKWAAAAGLGANTLGQWNRAEVLTTVPLYQVQNALIQVAYPEFRKDQADGIRARRVWPDALGLVAWGAFPLAGALVIVGPVLVPVLFGPGWQEAAAYLPWLAVAGATQMLVVMLGGALEALGRFRWIWATQGLLLVLIGVGATAGILLQEPRIFFAAMIAGNVLQHGVHVYLCASIGYLNARQVLRHYGSSITVAGLFAGLLWGHLWILALNISYAILILAIVDAVIVLFLLRTWRLLPPVRILRHLGVLGHPALRANAVQERIDR